MRSWKMLHHQCIGKSLLNMEIGFISYTIIISSYLQYQSVTIPRHTYILMLLLLLATDFKTFFNFPL